MKSANKRVGWFIRYVTDPVDWVSEVLKKNTRLNSQDWIIAIVTGIAVVTALHLFKTKQIDISGLLSSLVLLATFTAILWNTKETYWLKVVQQKTLNQQRVRDDMDIAPFIDVGLSYTSGHFLTVLNRGRGLAKLITLTLKFVGETCDVGISGLSPGESFEPDDIRDQDFLNKFGGVDDSKLGEITAHVTYLDMLGRSYIGNFTFMHSGSAFFLVKADQKPVEWKFGETSKVSE